MRWNPTADGGGFWSVTRHADIKAVSRDPETFSSHRAGIFLHADQVTPLELNRNLLLYKDPREHTKYRKILQTAFVPNTVNRMESEIRARITRVIDKVIEAGECDFVADVAVPVPLGVLAQLMGLPDEDMPSRFRRRSRRSSVSPPSSTTSAAPRPATRSSAAGGSPRATR